MYRAVTQIHHLLNAWNLKKFAFLQSLKLTLISEKQHKKANLLNNFIKKMFESHNLKIVEVSEESYKLPKDFVTTAVIVMALVLQYVVTMYAVTMRARLAAFSGRFMK